MDRMKDFVQKEKREEPKELFHRQLDSIIESELSVENINTYADDVIRRLVELSEQVRDTYLSSHPTDSGLDPKTVEDSAFREFDLQEVEQFLTIASNKLESIRRAESFIAQNILHVPEIITPPDTMEQPIVITGEHKFEKPNLKDRLKTLLYILQNNGVDLQHIRIFEGDISPDMMRQTSYVTVLVPDLKRLVQICDEEGNASYIFDSRKLEELGVSTEDVNRMTKDDKNAFLSQHRTAGQRFIYTPRWARRVDILLTEDLEEKILPPVESSRGKKDVPAVSTGELDPWNGFFTDDEGNHWGTVAAIVKKFSGPTREGMDGMISRIPDPKTMTIIDAAGHQRKSYLFEEIAGTDEGKKYFDVPQVGNEGEWDGFWTDPATGKHFGTVGVMTTKMSLPRTYIEKKLDLATIETREVRDRAGRLQEAYAYEDVAQFSEVRDLLKTPIIEKSGEWAGFYFDGESGYHFGTLKAIIKKLGISYSKMEELVQVLSLSPKKIRTSSRSSAEGYPYELLARDNFIIEKNLLSKSDNEGEWKGFYTDENGSHWGSTKAISDKLRVNRKVINYLITKYGFPHKRMVSFHIIDGYRLEDFSSLQEIIELNEANILDNEGEWKGYYTDPVTARHWGTVRSIADRLELSYSKIEKITREFRLPSIKVRSRIGEKKGGVFSAFKIEDVLEKLK